MEVWWLTDGRKPKTNNRVQSELVTIRIALLNWLDLTHCAIDERIGVDGIFDYQNKIAMENVAVAHSLMRLSAMEEDEVRPARQTPTLRIVAQCTATLLPSGEVVLPVGLGIRVAHFSVPARSCFKGLVALSFGVGSGWITRRTENE